MVSLVLNHSRSRREVLPDKGGLLTGVKVQSSRLGWRFTGNMLRAFGTQPGGLQRIVPSHSGCQNHFWMFVGYSIGSRTELPTCTLPLRYCPTNMQGLPTPKRWTRVSRRGFSEAQPSQPCCGWFKFVAWSAHESFSAGMSTVRSQWLRCFQLWLAVVNTCTDRHVHTSTTRLRRSPPFPSLLSPLHHHHHHTTPSSHHTTPHHSANTPQHSTPHHTTPHSKTRHNTTQQNTTQSRHNHDTITTQSRHTAHTPHTTHHTPHTPHNTQHNTTQHVLFNVKEDDV